LCVGAVKITMYALSCTEQKIHIPGERQLEIPFPLRNYRT